jgi:hypothetical protein
MILEIFADLGYLLLLINTIFFFIGFSKNGRAYRIFAFYLCIMFIIQIIVSIMQYMRIDNLFLSHFYFILQFIILSFFYLNLQFKKQQDRIVKGGLVFCLTTLALQYVLNPSIFFKFDLFEIFITSFLLIAYATFHLYNLLNEKRTFYYINLGILTYLFGSTVLFLAGNLVAKLRPEFNDVPWILNSILYVFYQILILMEYKVSFYKRVHITVKNE